MKLIAKDIFKSYNNGKIKTDVLNGISCEFESGKFYLIKGDSGAGKSTLLHILGTLDDATSGIIELDGTILSKINNKEISNIRYKKLGFVFQSFYLNPYLNSLDNIMMPMFLNKKYDDDARKNKALELLNLVGLIEKKNNYPNQLSGGEQQRIAIARALANDPQIILADEPTGNLDSKNQEIIFKILKKIAEDNKIVIVVSHSKAIEEYADVIYNIKDGRFINE